MSGLYVLMVVLVGMYFRGLNGQSANDFGCTVPFDAVDLAPDDLYYYFIGQYLYTEERLTTTIIGPRLTTDYFTGVTLPVIAAFTIGPLDKAMYIIDSAAAASNVKIFRFTSSDPLPRTINQTTSVATLFPTGVPSPVTATLTAYTPARVWIFGGAASTAEPSVTAYNYATSTGAFTYYGLVSKQWTNTLVTAASHWYNATSGVMRYHLFDSSSPSPNVVEVDTALQYVAPSTPAPISSCPKWNVPQMSGCCQLPTTTTLATATVPATPAPLPTTTLAAAPTTTTSVSAPAGACPNEVDAVDLASDNMYYFFSGSTVYTVNKLNFSSTPPTPISSKFTGLVLPIIAAFTTGPLNGRMYIIDSDALNNVKVFKVATTDALPRAAILTTSLTALFPAATANIPAPLTAAFSSFSPARVYLFGGTAGSRKVAQYSYSTSSQTFTYISTTNTLAAQWDVDVKAATMYYNRSNGTAFLYAFSSYQTAKVDAALTITNGPSSSGSCPSWQPVIFNPCCTATTTTVTTMVPVATMSTTIPPPNVTCGSSPDAIDLAPDNNYYFFYGFYFNTATKVTNTASSPVLISTKFANIVPPVIAAFSIGPLNAKMFIIDSSPTNNVKVYNFSGSSTPIQPNMTGSLTFFFPQGSSIPRPLTAVLATFTPARAYFFGGSPPTAFMYSYTTTTTAFTPLGSNTNLAAAWPSNIKAASMYYFPRNGSSALFVFNETADAQVNPNLLIVQGPSGTANCDSWLPTLLSANCCPGTTVIPSSSTPAQTTSTILPTTKTTTNTAAVTTSRSPATTTVPTTSTTREPTTLTIRSSTSTATAPTTSTTASTTTTTTADATSSAPDSTTALQTSNTTSPITTTTVYTTSTNAVTTTSTSATTTTTPKTTATTTQTTTSVMPTTTTTLPATTTTAETTTTALATSSTTQPPTSTTVPVTSTTPRPTTTTSEATTTTTTVPTTSSTAETTSTTGVTTSTTSETTTTTVEATTTTTAPTSTVPTTSTSAGTTTGLTTSTTPETTTTTTESTTTTQPTTTTTVPTTSTTPESTTTSTTPTPTTTTAPTSTTTSDTTTTTVAATTTTTTIPTTTLPTTSTTAETIPTTTTTPQTTTTAIDTTTSTVPATTTTVEITSTTAETSTTTDASPTTTAPTTTIVPTTTSADTTTTTNPCPMSVFCSSLPDSAVNGQNGQVDATGGYASDGTGNFQLFSGGCVLQINYTGPFDPVPVPIRNYYGTSRIPVKKAYVDDFATYLTDSSGTDKCNVSVYPEACVAASSLAIDAFVSSYSTWKSSDGSQIFYVVADATGENLFVTDGSNLYGSSVSIAYNQGIIQTVTALQHISESDGLGMEVDTVYVFGEDAHGSPYFGVFRVLPTSVSAMGVADSLADGTQWIFVPVPYQTIYGPACPSFTTPPNTCDLQTFCTTSPSAAMSANPADGSPYYYMFNGPCTIKFTIDATGTQFTPKLGPTLNERFFYGTKAPLLAGITIQDAFFTLLPSNQLQFNLVTHSNGSTVICDEIDYNSALTPEPRCFSTGSTDRTDISDHSSWLLGSSVFYLVTNGANAQIAVNDGTATSSNTVPTAASGLTNITALLTFAGESGPMLAAFGTDTNSGNTAVAYGVYSSTNGYGLTSGDIQISWSAPAGLDNTIVGCI